MLTDIQEFCFSFVISKLYFNKEKKQNTTKSLQILASAAEKLSRPLVSPADQGSQGTLEGGLQGSLAKQGINYLRPSINHIMTGCRVILVMGEAKVIKLGSPGERAKRRAEKFGSRWHLPYWSYIHNTVSKSAQTVGFASTTNVTPLVCLG